MAAEHHTRHHRIGRVVFDLRFLDENQAFGTRQGLEEVFSRTIVPLLQEAFDAVAANGAVYRIPRLEIDLGFFDPARLDADLTRRLIHRHLDQRLKDLSAEEIEIMPVESALKETLIRFLETGSWPWHSIYGGLADLEEGWHTLTPAESRRLLVRLWPLLRRRHVRLRLIHQFSPRLFAAVIGSLHPQTARDLWRIGRAILGGLETIESQEVLLAVAADLPFDEPTAVPVLEEQIRARAQLLLTTEAEAVSSEPDRTAGFSGGMDSPLEPTPAAAPLEKVLFVRHAGIVLLHPFLQRLFEQVGLLDDRQQFISAAARVRAVHLLNFLATGAENPEEPETLLFKVLCGFPSGPALPKYLPLSAPEKSEAEALLAAAIGHWEKLKNTSLAGLREGFLQREGKLTHDRSRWKLVVEPHSIDVLLGSLPWSLSVVRLPWMEWPIYLDWV